VFSSAPAPVGEGGSAPKPQAKACPQNYFLAPALSREASGINFTW